MFGRARPVPSPYWRLAEVHSRRAATHSIAENMRLKVGEKRPAGWASDRAWAQAGLAIRSAASIFQIRVRKRKTNPAVQHFPPRLSKLSH
jgi:hypothetical protein